MNLEGCREKKKVYHSPGLQKNNSALHRTSTSRAAGTKRYQGVHARTCSALEHRLPHTSKVEDAKQPQGVQPTPWNPARQSTNSLQLIKFGCGHASPARGRHVQKRFAHLQTDFYLSSRHKNETCKGTCGIFFLNSLTPILQLLRCSETRQNIEKKIRPLITLLW